MASKKPDPFKKRSILTTQKFSNQLELISQIMLGKLCSISPHQKLFEAYTQMLVLHDWSLGFTVHMCENVACTTAVNSQTMGHHSGSYLQDVISRLGTVEFPCAKTFYPILIFCSTKTVRKKTDYRSKANPEIRSTELMTLDGTFPHSQM